MLLLSCTNIRRGYGAEPLFAEVSFEVRAGDRIGLVGPNGAGKTTLLRVLAGLDEPESGEVQRHAGARIGLLEQHPQVTEAQTVREAARAAFAELLAAQREFEEVAAELASCTDAVRRRQLASRYERLHELLRCHDAYELDHKVEAVLSGLGFGPDQWEQDVRTLSGGQQRRLLLARLLLAAPDVLLLDEPSNHLDIDMCRWLEDYLVRQPQGMLIVSHDRYFLNKVANRILELHQRRITHYPGNYDQYVRLREERYQRQLKEYEAQQEWIARQEEYIRRVHYGQLARQAQSRAKALEKLERLEKPVRPDVPPFHFRAAARSGDIVVRAERLGHRYGDRVLFRDLSFDLPRGRRLGIVGPNGSGKTTLLRVLLGQETPTEGRVALGHRVTVGYCDQHLEVLDPDLPLLQAVRPADDPNVTEQLLRDRLAGFGLSGEIVERPVRELSGGERSRAALARLTLQHANLLVLDEPTNHLDIWACEALEQALREFDGTVIVVSHDRYFLNRVADMLIVFADGTTEVVYGNYDTYEALRQSRLGQTGSGQTSRGPAAAGRAVTGQAVAGQAVAGQAVAGQARDKQDKGDKSPSVASGGRTPRRKRRFPYRPVAAIEADIAACEQAVAELEAALQNPELYRDGDRVRSTLQQLEQRRAELNRLYEHWEEAVELNG